MKTSRVYPPKRVSLMCQRYASLCAKNTDSRLVTDVVSNRYWMINNMKNLKCWNWASVMTTTTGGLVKLTPSKKKIRTLVNMPIISLSNLYSGVISLQTHKMHWLSFLNQHDLQKLTRGHREIFQTPLTQKAASVDVLREGTVQRYTALSFWRIPIEPLRKCRRTGQAAGEDGNTVARQTFNHVWQLKSSLTFEGVLTGCRDWAIPNNPPLSNVTQAKQ